MGPLASACIAPRRSAVRIRLAPFSEAPACGLVFVSSTGAGANGEWQFRRARVPKRAAFGGGLTPIPVDFDSLSAASGATVARPRAGGERRETRLSADGHPQPLCGQPRALPSRRRHLPRELGLQASLHRTEVRMLERGYRIPRIDTLVKLAGALEVRPEYLLDGVGWPPGGAGGGVREGRASK